MTKIEANDWCQWASSCEHEHKTARISVPCQQEAASLLLLVFFCYEREKGGDRAAEFFEFLLLLRSMCEFALARVTCDHLLPMK